jgi:hypothetical protein
MKLKAKSHISNNNKNVVYVINNNPPRRRRQNKSKSTVDSTVPDNPTQQSSGGGISLPDNRFLNSSSLGTEIQRANLNLIENPQLRINQPNTPLLENSYDQRLLQIRDALQQQIENTRHGINYFYSRFDSAPIIDEPNDEDNFGNFAETEGSDYFVNEGDTKPNFASPRQSAPDAIDDINTTPYADAEPTLITSKSAKVIKRKTGFQSPKAIKIKTPIPQPQSKSPYTLPTTDEEFNDIPIEEPSYAIKQAPPTTGKMDAERLRLREQYKQLGGQDKHILNTPVKNLRVTQMKQFIKFQEKLNKTKSQYITNNGNDPDILESQSLKVVENAVKALIKQNNAQKKR